MSPALEPDLVLVADRVVPVHPKGARASWVAVKGDRIVAVGSDSQDRPRGRREVRVEGCVVPGFHDAHAHTVHYGASLTAVDLRYPDVRDWEQAYAAIAEAAANVPEGGWVFAENYDQNKLGGHPRLDRLDAAAPGRLVRVGHNSRHMCTVNSRVIDALGLGEQADPPGGRIDRDASGRATGLLLESAMELLRPLTWPLPLDRIAGNIAAAHERYVGEGLTAVQEAGIGTGLAGTSPAEGAAFQLVRRRGTMRVRTTMMVSGSDLHHVSAAENDGAFGLDLGLTGPLGDLWLRVGGVKLFSDGSLIGRSAAMHAPYADDAGNAGMLVVEPEELREVVRAAHGAGWQVATHAIGDRAVDVVLDAYEAVLRDDARQDHRHRIEHAGVVSPEALGRMARLGVIPSPQGRFVGELGDGMARALGSSRIPHCYRGRAFLDHGIELPASSDRPVVGGAPLRGIHDLVNRRTDSGEPFAPEEALSPEEALRAYTYGSAHATFLEHEMGSLEAGKLADLVVLSDDPTAVDPGSIKDIDVVATVIGGEAVFDRDGRLDEGRIS